MAKARSRKKLKKGMIAYAAATLCLMLLSFVGGLLVRGQIDSSALKTDAGIGYVEGIPIYTDFLPEGSRARPGTVREIKYLVIHETDNTSAGANAAAHNSFIHQNADAESGIVSWHYTVDDHEIYHHLPDDESAYHAGDQMTEDGGNKNGIGIELCVNEDGDFEQTLINAEKLCARLLIAYGLKPEQALKKHEDFSGKVCPATLIAEDRWDEFCTAVAERYNEMKTA